MLKRHGSSMCEFCELGFRKCELYLKDFAASILSQAYDPYRGGGRIMGCLNLWVQSFEKQHGESMYGIFCVVELRY